MLRGPLKLWIRVEADSPDDPRVGAIADRLDIDSALAFGMYVRVLCKVAQHACDGSLATVSARTLEDWAGWRGARGQFAEVFREQFVDAEGMLAEWTEQQGKLIEKAAKDAARQRARYEAEKARREGEASVDPPPNNGGGSADSPRRLPGASDGTRTETVTEQEAVVREVAPHVALTVAANLGIAARWGEQPIALRASHPSALEVAEVCAAEGIPLEVARSAIYAACVASKLPRPPRSLCYFRDVVRSAWVDEQARRAALTAEAPKVLPLRAPSVPTSGANAFLQLLEAERAAKRAEVQ
jgi:hypothetical protein